MDKKIFGLIAAVSGLGTLGAAQAGTPPESVDRVMTAQSFGELLEPIPNAAAILRVVDEGQTAAPEAASVQLAADHHHHHHHHGFISRFLNHRDHHHHYRNHHHHHHNTY